MSTRHRPPRLADALRGFAFRLLSPATAAGEDGAFHIARSDGSVATLLEAPGCPLDPWVIDFGTHDASLRPLLEPLLGMPRMGRLAFAGILNIIVRRMPPEHAFVNVGVWHGFSLLAAMAGNDDKVCLGVDNFSEFGGPRDEFLQRFLARRSPRHRFYNQDYEDFFAAGLDRPVGAYYYDGAHEYEHQYRGLMAAEPLYADGAIIVVDDVSWQAPREATLKFAEDSRLDWQVVLDQSTASPNHPTLWNGTMVLQANIDDEPPLRIPTLDPLRTLPRRDRSGRASLSAIVVGDHDGASIDGDVELVQAGNAYEIRAAIEASTGTHAVIANSDTSLSSDALWSAVEEYEGDPGRV